MVCSFQKDSSGERGVITSIIIIEEETFKKMLIRKERDKNILYWSCNPGASDFSWDGGGNSAGREHRGNKRMQGTACSAGKHCL